MTEKDREREDLESDLECDCEKQEEQSSPVEFRKKKMSLMSLLSKANRLLVHSQKKWREYLFKGNAFLYLIYPIITLKSTIF